MTPDEMVTTIKNYWFDRGYDGTVVWWEKVEEDKMRYGAIPRSARFVIKSNIVNGYPPRDKQ